MFGLNKFGDGIGIDRILRFYRAHDIDVDSLVRRSIVITGSNGKGSTARLLAGALRATGRRVGCFTSPHLFDFRERFLVDDDRISTDAFDRHAATVLAFNAGLPEGDRMGAFEFLFLVAVLWFLEEAPDVIVWEAGIGGRYDPVRTVRANLSVLTSLELEHTQLLGATEELIAYDKIDALAPGGTVIVSPSVDARFRARIASYCSLTGRTSLFAADRMAAGEISNSADGTRFSINVTDRQPVDVHLQLIGDHQVDNALAALCAADVWLGTASPGLPRLSASLAAVRWPGRLEKVAAGPDLWIDVGHTPHALDLVTQAFLDFHPREKTLVVFGVSASKDIRSIASIVASRFDHFILTRARKSGADTAAFADLFAGCDATIEPDILLAAKSARTRASREGLAVLALGGLFLAVEVQHAWTGGDPAELEFF